MTPRTGAPLDDSAIVHSVHPLRLVSPRRLDLICKYLFFRELLAPAEAAGSDISGAAQLYEKHIIRRTGGVEPPDPFRARPDARKQSVADYVREAKALVESLHANGFDRDAAIAYFADGTLGNGAHRVAAALALDIPVFAKLHGGSGTAWGFNWFVENGFTTEEVQRLLYTYAVLKSDRVAVFVFYAPARTYWDAFAKTIAESLHVVGHIDLSIDSQSTMYELVHDLYGTLEPLSSTGVINRKALLLAMAKPLAVRVLVAEQKADGEGIYSAADEAKNICRQLARETVALESYLSVHASASQAETSNLAGVLLSPNNLRQLNRRRSAGARVQFLEWLGECRNACRRSDIALDDICVVGSSPLEVIGVRDSTDIDFTLKSRYREARYGRGVTHLTPVVDIVTAGYHRSRTRPAVADDELIDSPDHHFIFRGMKFANPEIVLDQKDFYRRDKDVRDIERASDLSGRTQSRPFDPAFEFALRCEVLLRELTETAPRITTGVVRRPSAYGLDGLRAFVRSKVSALARRFDRLHSSERPDA